MTAIAEEIRRRAWRQHLQSLQRSGVTYLRRSREPSSASIVDNAPRSSPLLSQNLETSAVTSPEELPTIPQPGPALTTLTKCVADCRRCEELAAARTQTVFGVGDPDARIMFIGEAPGADEDRSGVPFVGRAGKLLDRIIEACRLKREQIYICNILKCRPPGNRNPSAGEADNCREYLDGQIAAVNPEYIVCWGTIAARNLLKVKDPIGKMRKQFFVYGSAKVLCTYHPSYLLRNPPAKKDVWADMKFLLHEMGIDLDAEPG